MADQYVNKIYWEHLREHIEILGNLMGTNIKTKNAPLAPPNPKERSL
jgi:hypothetical protein